jgi:hypothetical protein
LYLRGRRNRRLKKYNTTLQTVFCNNITDSDEYGLGTAGDVEKLMIKRIGQNISERNK